MFNPFLVAFFLFHFFFFLSSAAVVYHLVKYQLNKTATTVTTGLFLAGAGLLFIINIIFSIQVDWSQYNIIF